MLGLNLTRQDKKLMIKYAKKFWNVYTNVNKRNVNKLLFLISN
jgi:hypothetical protein